MSGSAICENSSFVFSVPSEVIEQVFVCLVEAGDPETIASVAETCKFFHALIFNSNDHHLWREIFLTTFDDTRILLAWLTSATPTGCALGGSLEDKCTSIAYPWEPHFKRRIQAARTYRRTGPSSDVEALRVIISTLLSAPPLHSASLHPHPDSDLFRFVSSPLSSIPPSLNAQYVKELLGPGLPLDAAAEILRPKANSIQDYINHQLPLFKLAFLVGFDPKVTTIPEPPEDGRRLDVEEGDRMNARSLARRKVYDMRYTTVEQCWGPFILLTPMSAMSPDDKEGDVDSEIGGPVPSSPSLHPGSGAVHIAAPTARRNIPIVLQSSVDDDFDDEHEDEHGFDDDTDEEDPVEHYIHPPVPHRLIPDYSWLSAARFIIECNLRRLADSDWEDDHGDGDWGNVDGLGLIESLKNLDLLRMGGVAGFWQCGWNGPLQPEDDAPIPGPSVIPVKSSARWDIVEPDSNSDSPGWDWAGVGGQWLRTVCWMGYPDLIQHNKYIAGRREAEPEIQEQVGIFPMALRITGYLPPPPAPPGLSLSEPAALVYKLPIIQVEGNSVGSDHNASEQRELEGTVRMIGDGTVRWSMRSHVVGSNRTEWVTEGVQVGAIGSGMGVLGLWTGPEHQRLDPLGPWWLWKVSDVVEFEERS